MTFRVLNRSVDGVLGISRHSYPQKKKRLMQSFQSCLINSQRFVSVHAWAVYGERVVELKMESPLCVALHILVAIRICSFI